MTMPNEARNSIKRAREFLYRLLDPKATPRVPKTVRREAGRMLRHFPFDCHVDELETERERIPWLCRTFEEL